MAMSGPALQALLEPAIKSALQEFLDIQDAAQAEKVAKAIAKGVGPVVVTYLQANAVVTPTALIAPPGGGTVTGTGTLA